MESPARKPMPATAEPKPTELHAAIKRGIDARARRFHVALRSDGATLLPDHIGVHA